MRVENFNTKWKFYTDAGRAQAISRTYFPNAESTKQAIVASKFPRESTDTFPFSDTDGEAMTAAGFSYWLSSKNLPTNRVRAFERLTSLEIDDWLLPFPQFKELVSRRAGEIVGWADLVKHAVRGAIKVEVRGDQADLRFQPIAEVEKEPPATAAWPGCRARVWLPDDARPGREDTRHAWLIADYGLQIFVLDPLRTPDGTPSTTQLNASTRALPRNRDQAVGLSTQFLPGQTFDTIVLTFDLDDQPDAIVQAFRGLERKLVEPQTTFAANTYRAIRDTLDEAATLMQQHKLDYCVYCEPCLVVSMLKHQAPNTTNPAHS